MLTQIKGFAAYRKVFAGVAPDNSGHNNQSEQNESTAHIMTRRQLIGPVFMDESGTVHILDTVKQEGFPLKEWMADPENGILQDATEPQVVIELMDPSTNK